MQRLCLKCEVPIPKSAWIDGRQKNLQNRRYCLTCSPFGTHNTRRAGEKRRSEISGLLCKRCSKPLNDSQLKGRICWACYYGARACRRLDRVYEIVGEQCWRCGYGRGPEGRRLLDFHHVDPRQKQFGLDARNLVNLSWSRVSIELRRCVLLCANCHRECEAGLIPIADILSIHAHQWNQRAPNADLAVDDR